MIQWHALITHLYNEEGHRYVYHLCFREAVQSLRYFYCGYTNRDCPISNLPPDWEKRLRWKDEQSLLLKCKQFFIRFSDFSKAFLKFSSKEERRFYFLESYCLMDLAALAFSILYFFRKKDSFFLLLRFDLATNGMTRSKRTAYTILLKVIQKKLRHRLVLLADTERISTYFHSLLDHKVHVVPIPHTETPSPRMERSSEKISLWWPGGPRVDKGLSEILSLCDREDPSHRKFELRISEALKGKINEKNLSVCFVKSALSRAEYNECMNHSDMILLPYDADSYYSRSSGIFVEAIFSGKMPLVKEGSWLAFELKKYGLDALIIRWEEPDLFSQMERLFKDPEIALRLEKMRQIYIDFHSKETYTKVLDRIIKSHQSCDDFLERNGQTQ